MHIILFIQHSTIMQSSMFALVALSMLLAVVQCTREKSVTEYEIKEGIDLFSIDSFRS